MTQQALRYSRTAMLLHWAIALLLVLNFGLGERTEHLRDGPELFWAMQLHKSFGITVLLLSVWRLVLRVSTPRPAKAADSDIAQFLSSAVHWGFYAVMIIVPITGWIIVSTAKVQLPTLLFGIVPWPHLPNFGRDAHEVAEEIHEILAKVMIPLLALHILGAVRHQFLLRDALVERMVPVKRVSALGFVLLIASLVLAFLAGKNWPAPSVATQAEALPDFQSANNTAKPNSVPTGKEIPLKAAQVGSGAAQTPEKNQIATWKMLPGGQLGFTIIVNGETVKGRFAAWKADIRFDPAQLDRSSVRADVELASVSSGDNGRDDMLKGEDFFGTARPEARFSATGFRARGSDRFETAGSLSMKGVSRPVTLAFSLKIKGDTAQATGTGQLDRRDFGVGTGQFASTDMIAGDVLVDFAFSARKIAQQG